MSTISNIVTALTQIVSTSLPTHTRMPNPYVVEQNAETWLNKGFGIGVGPGVREDRDLCNAYYSRTFQVVITRLVYATENNTDERASIDLSILEDFQGAFIAIEREKNLLGNAIDCRVESDGGVQFYDSERLKFIFMTIEITVSYMEKY